MSANKIVQIIIAGGSTDDALTLDMLSEVHKILLSNKQLPDIGQPTVIIHGLEAQRAFVLYPKLSNTILLIKSDTRLKPEQFRLVLSNPVVWGDIEPATFLSRFYEEVYPIIIAIIIFLVTLIIFGLSSNEAAKNLAVYLNDPVAKIPSTERFLEFYRVVGEALLTILSIFLSVFVLFTISQNVALASDTSLYQIGYTHKYARDDRYISAIAGCALFFTFLGLLMTALPKSLEVPGSSLNQINLFIPICYGFALAGFYICLYSLRYYAQRVLLSNEANLVQHLIQSIFKPKAQTNRTETNLSSDPPSTNDTTKQTNQ